VGDITVKTSSTEGLLSDALHRSTQYLDSLAQRPVAPPAQAIAALSQLDEPLPLGTSDPARTLAARDHRVGR